VPIIDSSNFYRNYQYQTFNATVKQLQYNQFHRQFDLICKLDFSNQCISDKKLELFCSAVKNQQQLFQLNLSKNEISDKGIYHFSSTVLRSLSSLKMLDLSWNLLTDYSIRILADLDYYSSSLEQLNLSFNHLTSLSAYYLSLFYTKDFHCSIKRLVLGGTHNKGNLHSSTAWGNEYLKIFVGRLLTSEVGRLIKEKKLRTIDLIIFWFYYLLIIIV
jgi:Leucine-rich repeat (LRR) protein